MKRNRNYLVNMYNATSTADPPGSDQLETYEAWLERQLLRRIEILDNMPRGILTTDSKVEFHPLPLELRDRFAAEAMQAIVQAAAQDMDKAPDFQRGFNPFVNWEAPYNHQRRNIAKWAYKMADEMLKAREEVDDEG